MVSNNPAAYVSKLGPQKPTSRRGRDTCLNRLSWRRERTEAVVAVLWMVQKVIELGSKLHLDLFSDLEALEDIHIKIIQAWRAQRGTSQVACTRWVGTALRWQYNVHGGRGINRCVRSIGIDVTGGATRVWHCSYTFPTMWIVIRAVAAAVQAIGVQTIRDVQRHT